MDVESFIFFSLRFVKVFVYLGEHYRAELFHKNFWPRNLCYKMLQNPRRQKPCPTPTPRKKF